LKVQDGGGRHLEKYKNYHPYLGCGLSDFNKFGPVTHFDLLDRSVRYKLKFQKSKMAA